MSATADETKQLLAELVKQAIEPRWEAIKRIGLDGDVAMLVHEVTDADALALIERLRGRETAPVVRITRSKARACFEPSSDLHAFTTKRAPAGETRIVLFVRGAIVQVTRDHERRYHLGIGGQGMAVALRAPS